MRAAQRVIGILVMVEGRMTPFFHLMTLLAFFTEAIRVDVFYRMTTDTLFRRIFVVVLEVAGVTGRLAVRKLELEVGLVVIESGFAPVFWRVALGAVFAQFSRVRIVFGMTAIATRFGIPIVAICAVTGGALGLGMLADQPKIGEAVVEIILVQPDYPRLASTVVAMTGLTILACRIRFFAVEALISADVDCDRFMTVKTELILGRIA